MKQTAPKEPEVRKSGNTWPRCDSVLAHGLRDLLVFNISILGYNIAKYQAA